MRYSDLEDFLSTKLQSLGYGNPGSDPMPTFDPGPATDARLQKISPKAIVFLAIGDGRGFDTEQLFDQPFIRTHIVGKTNNFPSAESLAMDVDKSLCSVVGNMMVGTALTRFINRAGGGPSLLTRDAGERYHFSCTYITSTATGF